MEAHRLPPIPTPPAQRWREARLLFLPRAIFVAGLVVAGLIWTRWVSPATLVAEAEGVHAEVRTSQEGVLASVQVALLQPVRAGEVVGHVTAFNPRLFDANVALIRAELGMMTDTMQGATDRQRVALDFERLQLDWMSHRVELAAMQGQLQQAEADLARAVPLRSSGMVSQEAFDQLKYARDTLAAQAAEQGKLVAELEPRIRKFASSEALAAGLSSEPALAASIKVQEAKLKLLEEELAPAPLVAPIDGVVSLLLRRSGESVVAGEPVLHVTSTRPVRLAGYLRQPLPFEPKPGMTAEIRTRDSGRKIAATRILEVGSTMETISPNLIAAMRLPVNTPVEPGLRIHFALPEGLNLRPGEQVDVVIR